MVAELLVVLIEVQPHAVRFPPALPRERVPLRREVEDNGLYTKCSGLKWKRSGTEPHTYSNVFKTYSVEYASDPRFKIQGAGQSSPWHLES